MGLAWQHQPWANWGNAAQGSCGWWARPPRAAPRQGAQLGATSLLSLACSCWGLGRSPDRGQESRRGGEWREPGGVSNVQHAGRLLRTPRGARWPGRGLCARLVGAPRRSTPSQGSPLPRGGGCTREAGAESGGQARGAFWDESSSSQGLEARDPQEHGRSPPLHTHRPTRAATLGTAGHSRAHTQADRRTHSPSPRPAFPPRAPWTLSP